MPLSNAPKANSALTNAAVVFGILCSVGLIAVSAIVNFRFGFRMAETDTDGYIYGFGMGLADTLKALLPFFITAGVARKDGATVIGGGVLFVIFTINSLNAEIGFASQHRAFRVGNTSGEIEQRSQIRAELERAEATLVKLGPQRSEAEVAQAIEAIFAKPVSDGGQTIGKVSERCILNRRDTRDACASVALLATELERARQADELSHKAELLRLQLERLGPAPASADPQLDVLVKVAELMPKPLERDTIRTGLLVAVGLLFELGSGLGLYVATTPWRGSTRKEATVTEERMAVLGRVETFAEQCLVPVAGRHMTGTDLYRAYESWCARKQVVALRQSVFIEEFLALARQVGIGSPQRGSNVMFEDVGIEDLSNAQLNRGTGDKTDPNPANGLVLSN